MEINSTTQGTATADSAALLPPLASMQREAAGVLAATCLVVVLGSLAVYLLVLRVLTTCPHLWSANSFLIGSLAASEVLLQLVGLLTMYSQLFGAAWAHSPSFSLTLGVPIQVAKLVSMATSAAVMIDRYCFITRALHYLPISSRNIARRFIVMSWMVGAVLPFAHTPCWLGGCCHYSPDARCQATACMVGNLPSLLTFLASLTAVVFTNLSMLRTTFRHIDHDRNEANNRMRFSRTERAIATIGSDMVFPTSLAPLPECSRATTAQPAPPPPRSSTQDEGLCERRCSVDVSILSCAAPKTVSGAEEQQRSTDTSPDRPSERSSISQTHPVHVRVCSPLSDCEEKDFLHGYKRPAEAAQPHVQDHVSFKTAKPLELYLRVSCDMSGSSGLSESLSTISIENSSSREGMVPTPNAWGIPRIEVISPTTIGHGSVTSMELSHTGSAASAADHSPRKHPASQRAKQQQQQQQQQQQAASRGDASDEEDDNPPAVVTNISTRHKTEIENTAISVETKVSIRKDSSKCSRQNSLPEDRKSREGSGRRHHSADQGMPATESGDVTDVSPFQQSRSLVHAWLDDNTRLQSTRRDSRGLADKGHKEVKASPNEPHLLETKTSCGSRGTSICTDTATKMSLIDFLLDDPAGSTSTGHPKRSSIIATISPPQLSQDPPTTSRQSAGSVTRVSSSSAEVLDPPSVTPTVTLRPSIHAAKRKLRASLRPVIFIFLFFLRWAPAEFALIWATHALPANTEVFRMLQQLFLGLNLIAGLCQLILLVYTYKQFKFAIKDMIQMRGNRVAPHLVQSGMGDNRATVAPSI